MATNPYAFQEAGLAPFSRVYEIDGVDVTRALKGQISDLLQASANEVEVVATEKADMAGYQLFESQASC